jgi:hypothetical protein
MPDPGDKPPGPKKPTLRRDTPALDQEPEREAVRQPRAEPAKRTATLPGIPSVQVPRHSGEFAETLPAPNPLEKRTWRLPTPPSALAIARRTDPPEAQEARPGAPAAPDERQSVPRESVATRPPATSLPPASQTSGEAVQAAQRRELERLQAERDLAQAQLQLERLRAEEREAERAAEYDRLRLDQEAKLALQQLEIEKAKAVKPWIDERLVKALAAVLTALASLGVPLGIWLTTKTKALESAQTRDAPVIKDAAAAAGSAKAESSGTDQRLDVLEKQRAQERAYNRALLQRMGVDVPKRAGDPEPPKLETESPNRKPGTVTRGPVLVVKTPPP